MIELSGAIELRRLVLERWDSSVIRQSRSGYVRKFSCPDCGGDAFETFSKLTLHDETEWWGVEWRSACGYVFDGFSSDEIDSRFMQVTDESGAVVGMIDVSSPPPWRRWEPSQEPWIGCAEFTTLWQAMQVNVNDCRLIAAIQRRNRHNTRTRSARTR
jgi:hypothetical protein